MNLRRVIDISAVNYRRIFREISRISTDDDWVKIKRGRLLFLNSRRVNEIPAEFSPRDRVHLFGLESDSDIELMLGDDNVIPSCEIAFVVRIRRDNLYRFGTAILDRATVLFVLDYMPATIEERLHAFSLFHKSLLLRRTGSFLYYYSRIVDALTTNIGTPKALPDLICSLGMMSYLYQLSVLRNRVLQKYDVWYRYSRRRALANAPKSPRKLLKDCQHVVITGCYGTETAGDKAILKELVHVLREQMPEIKISITSIVPGLSRLTNLELGLDADILELRDLNYRHLGSVDLVVFGGGPLMDSSQIKYIDILFAWARRRGAATMIFGCGVGPLKTTLGIECAKSILQNATCGFFRDEHSACLAKELGFRGPKLHACDPAMRYVARWREQHDATPPGNPNEKLVALLRAQTSEYSESAVAESDRLQEEVIDLIQNYTSENPEREVVILPMHTFWLGNDDRDYINEIVSKLPAESQVTGYDEPQLLDVLLEKICNAAWGLPMRFHGHIFMLALNIPFVSVDYTGAKGKVANLIERYDLGDLSVSIADGIRPGEIQHRWVSMQANSKDIRARMHEQFREDFLHLEEIYDRLFAEKPGKDTA